MCINISCPGSTNSSLYDLELTLSKPTFFHLDAMDFLVLLGLPSLLTHYDFKIMTMWLYHKADQKFRLLMYVK